MIKSTTTNKYSCVETMKLLSLTLITLISNAAAFTHPTTPPTFRINHHSLVTPVAALPNNDLESSSSSSSNLNDIDDVSTQNTIITRRNALAASASIVGLTSASSSVRAEGEEEGRLIEFNVENLEDGGSGKIVIRTKPSWAPNGVVS